MRCVNCIKEDFCCCIQIHSKRTGQIQQVFLSLSIYFRHTKSLYAAALGIEILCIAAAEIGENTSFTLFGYRTHLGIAIGYLLGYILSSFATFATILGRYSYGSNEIVCGCCSVLEQGANKGLIPNLIITFMNFKIGVQKIPQLCKQPDLKHLVIILQTLTASFYPPSIVYRCIYCSSSCSLYKSKKGNQITTKTNTQLCN